MKLKRRKKIAEPHTEVEASNTTEHSHTKKESKMASAKSGGWKDVLLTLVVIPVAILIALILVLFVFQSYQVDGPSMEPTLQNNDRLIVWKLPKTWSKITGHAYIPDRGDIIIFTEPSLANKVLIKRVIGLPGDRVVVKDNKVTIYNKAHPKGFDPDTTLGYGKAKPNEFNQTGGNIDITIPAGEVFVNGDNRPDSLDSRYFGPVAAKDIIGKLAVRIMPVNKAETF